MAINGCLPMLRLCSVIISLTDAGHFYPLAICCHQTFTAISHLRLAKSWIIKRLMTHANSHLPRHMNADAWMFSCMQLTRTWEHRSYPVKDKDKSPVAYKALLHLIASSSVLSSPFSLLWHTWKLNSLACPLLYPVILQSSVDVLVL